MFINAVAGDDLYTTILRAGRLRRQAARLHQEADTLDSIARMRFQDDGGSAVAMVQTPGTVLCVAHGGPADGTVTRVPFNVVRDGELKLVPAPPAVCDAPLGDQAVAMFPSAYTPAMVVQLGQYVVGALVVRKGQVEELYGELRASRAASDDVPAPVAKAIARLLILSVGFNTELVDDILQSAERSAAATDAAPGEPMLVHLGGAAA